VKIRYNAHELLAAANYIWTHNKKVTNWPSKPTTSQEVAYLIKQHMIEIAIKNASTLKQGYTGNHDWINWTGTGGYMFTLTTDDDDTIDVNIFVSPSYKHTLTTTDL
jgi:hypothetical protein